MASTMQEQIVNTTPTDFPDAITDAVNVREAEPLSMEQVAERAETLENKWGENNVAIFEGPNGEFKGIEPDQHPVDIVINEVLAEYDNTTEPDMQDLYLDMRRRVQTRLTPELFEVIAPHIDEAIKTAGEIKALQSQYGELMAAHRDTALQRLIGHTDWDKMIELFMAEGWPEQASMSKDRALERMAFNVNSPNRATDLYGTHVEAQSIQKLINLATSLGATLDTALPEPDDGWFIQGDAVNAIKRWEDLTDKAIQYTSGLHHTEALNLRYDGDLYPLQRLARRLWLGDNNNAAVPSPILAAYERYVAKTLQDFDTQEAAKRHVDVHSRPNALYIGAAFRDKLADTAGIVDVPAWIQKRLERFGPRLSSGIGFIEFTNGDKSDHGTDIDDSMVTVGERVHNENKLRIDIQEGLATFAKSHGGAAHTQRIIRESIEETLDHEVAHHIHSAILSIAELRQWQEALETEPDLSINSYLRHLVNEGAPERRLLVEQFAITTELFMSNPLQIAIDYPQRFAVLNNIIERYLGDKIERLIAPVRELRNDGQHAEATRQLAFRACLLRASYGAGF